MDATNVDTSGFWLLMLIAKPQVCQHRRDTVICAVIRAGDQKDGVSVLAATT